MEDEAVTKPRPKKSVELREPLTAALASLAKATKKECIESAPCRTCVCVCAAPPLTM